MSQGFTGNAILGRTARHGTQSGYVIHRKYGETACDACKAAHASYRKIQKSREQGSSDLQLPRLTSGERRKRQ